MAFVLSHFEKFQSPNAFSSSVFLCKLNFPSTFFTCVLTVSSMIPNREAICLLVYPRHVSAVICCSRRESLSQLIDNQSSFSILLKPVETNSVTRSSASRLSIPARTTSASCSSVSKAKKRLFLARFNPNRSNNICNASIIGRDYIEQLFLCQSPSHPMAPFFHIWEMDS